jgi:hypothetical protein
MKALYQDEDSYSGGDADPGSGGFLTPGSGIQNVKKSGSGAGYCRIRDVFGNPDSICWQNNFCIRSHCATQFKISTFQIRPVNVTACIHNYFITNTTGQKRKNTMSWMCTGYRADPHRINAVWALSLPRKKNISSYHSLPNCQCGFGLWGAISMRIRKH